VQVYRVRSVVKQRLENVDISPDDGVVKNTVEILLVGVGSE
jgi:hypothetical protein